MVRKMVENARFDRQQLFQASEIAEEAAAKVRGERAAVDKMFYF